MQIFLIKNQKNKKLFVKNSPSFKEGGFTLIEILIAMLLMTFVLGFVIGNPFSSRDQLDVAIEGIERALRFSSDEAALRNTMVRLHFEIEEDSSTYSVQFGPDDSFILPTSLFEYSGNLSEREEKIRDKITKKVNSKFNNVREFEESGPAKIPNSIHIIGIGTSLYQKITTEAQSSVYFYPTGEKDRAIIFLGSEEELVTIQTHAFTPDIEIDYHKVDESIPYDEVAGKQLEMAEELFKVWKKN